MSCTATGSSSSSSSSATPTSTSAFTAASRARSRQLFRSTPLVYSTPLSRRTNKPVYLKLDALQASGSFKDRGMGHLCLSLKESGVTELISSSGGNAGLAVATVGQQLGLKVHVVVPQTTKPLVIEKLRQLLGAKVTVHGENWNEADLLARKIVEEDNAHDGPPTAAYISPYDHPLLWTGHSSLVDEIVDEIAEKNGPDVVPGAIIVSVGGGGLLCGTLEGLERRGLYQTAVIAAETEGAASFGKSFQQKKLIRLDAITSVATSLGALEVTPVTLERAQQHQSRGGIVREVICTDTEAVDACWEFAKDHRILVEPACGAALAVVYSERWLAQLADIEGPIVVEVCGGSGVNLELLQQWKQQIGSK